MVDRTRWYSFKLPRKSGSFGGRTIRRGGSIWTCPTRPIPKPSWYGESVGHYEGDTLVVDTIGLNDKTVVDVYRTPHTEKLHVVERWRMVDGGKAMEVIFTVDDPDAFYEPWTGMRRYRRVEQEAYEKICAENNTNLFDYHMPTAEQAGFLTPRGGPETNGRIGFMVHASSGAALRSEIGRFGLRDREQILAEMIAVVLGTDHLQTLVRHLAPTSRHVERFVEGVGVVDLDQTSSVLPSADNLKRSTTCSFSVCGVRSQSRKLLRACKPDGVDHQGVAAFVMTDRLAEP